MHFILPLAGAGFATASTLGDCPGYTASNVRISSTTLQASLNLAGTACNVYGTDLTSLTLSVSYETDERLHVLIQDVDNSVYQIPASVFPRPGGSSSNATSSLVFSYVESPFSFAVARASSGEILFDTSGAQLVFESQYVRLRTRLPANPNIYGIGEHSDSLHLNTTDYVRTLWSADAYGVPTGSNLYGNHPVYFEHRTTGTHGVFLLNSNGMDIKINNTATDGQYLEYNTLGGVLDLYFLAGNSPVEVAQQYSGLVGLPQMMPYWGFGYHNCRYGYQDAYNLAEVVYNYSKAGIPLETMWTDIDYMDGRKVFSLDPERFPLTMMQELLIYLHDHDQHYIMMVDPAVAYQQYSPFERGVADDIFLLRDNGSIYQGVVWPGVTAFPDWFKSNTQAYWNNEFATFFSPDSGVNIDALWIDMNEASSFGCNWPCDNPYQSAIGFPPTPPPVRSPPRPLPGFSCDFQPWGCNSTAKRQEFIPEIPHSVHQVARHRSSLPKRADNGTQMGLAERDLTFPKYAIHNMQAYTIEDNAAGGGLSNHTINTNTIHHNGLAEYDVHNLYGTMMSTASHSAMLERRPTKRPMIITRSTYAGAGTRVGHWLGDNISDWDHYRLAIRSMIAFAAIYQIPMVGADTCGYGDNTTEQLCARWSMLGAFAPFYRNHNAYPPSISQEYYRWGSVTEAAKKAIDLRYKLLDNMYTALYIQTTTGTPMISPMFYLYPSDRATFALENQYFYGPSIMIAPVLYENATSVSVYFPDDIFYDAWTYKLISTKAQTMNITNQSTSDIPVFYRGGYIIAMRENSAMTTTDLRKQNFNVVVIPGRSNEANGNLYLDDGESLVQDAVTFVDFSYSNGTFSMSGKSVNDTTYAYQTNCTIATITLLGVDSAPSGFEVDGNAGNVTYDAGAESAVFEVGRSFTADFSLKLI